MDAKLDIPARLAVFKAIQVIDLFQSVDPQMTIGEAKAFLAASGLDGAAPQDVEALTGISRSQINRDLNYLAHRGRNGEAGVELLLQLNNPQDYRKKLYRVSPRGAQLVTQLTNIFRLRK